MVDKLGMWVGISHAQVQEICFWMLPDQSTFSHAMFQVLSLTTTRDVMEKEWSNASFKINSVASTSIL